MVQLLQVLHRTHLSLLLLLLLQLLLLQHLLLRAIPLKYGVKDGVTTLKVDKEMMMPYMPLITSLVDAFLPDGDIEVSLDPESDPMKIPAKALVNSLLDALFNQSQSIEIGIGLTK